MARPPGALVALLVLAPNAAAGQTWQIGARVGGSAERIPLELSQTRFVSGTTLPETETTSALRLRLFGETEHRPVDPLGLTFGLDTGLLELNAEGARLDRRPVDEQLTRTLALGRVQAELQLGADGVVALRAGRTRPRIGEGAVFDAYAFAFAVDVDLSVTDAIPLSLLARVLLPDGTFTPLRKTSPLLDVQVSYRLGWFSRLTLMSSVFFDTGDELADPVRSALFKGRDDQINDTVDTLVNLLPIDRDTATQAVLQWIDANVDVQTEGVISWTGLSATLGDDDYSVRLTGLGAFGRLQVSTPPTAQRMNAFQGVPLPGRLQNTLIDRFSTVRSVGVQAFFGEVQARLELTEGLEVGTFGLLLTGDEGLSLASEAPTIGAFLGLAPLLPRTAVFFGGTFGPDQATPTAFSLAPDGSGIVAAGASVGAYPGAWAARLEGAVMSALVPSRFTGGTLYGGEVDAHLQYWFWEPLAAFVDGGILFPGPFFEDRRPAVQVVMGVQMYLESER